MTPLHFPPIQGDTPLIATVIEDAFGAADVDRIEAIFESAQLEQARMVGDVVNLRHRNSRVAWVVQDRSTSWLLQAMLALVQEVNAQYRFDMWGFWERFQLAEYQEGGHFDWHVDAGVQSVAPRKLSFTLQLSDPSSYEGGDLELWAAEKVMAPRKRGTLFCFPSYTLHRVSPVTRGARRALVAWATGPQIR